MDFMKISIIQSRYRSVIFVGISGGTLFVCIVLLLFYLTTSLSPEDALSRVRQCIQREISQRHRAILEEKGIRLPDVVMAMQWKEEIDQANNLKFVSIKVKRPLPDILFSLDSPTYVVRVVFRDKNQQYSPR